MVQSNLKILLLYIKEAVKEISAVSLLMKLF